LLLSRIFASFGHQAGVEPLLILYNNKKHDAISGAKMESKPPSKRRKPCPKWKTNIAN
jgi:hypothetical protein